MMPPDVGRESDMTDPLQQCPSTWRQLQDGSTRVCASEDSGYRGAGTCKSALYTTGRQYTKVCGRAIGYQLGTHVSTILIPLISLDLALLMEYLVPTCIWTFAGDNSGQGNRAGNGWECPCNSSGNVVAAPSFVGNNYFCESGNPTTTTQYHWYTNDQLWDGQQCAGEGQCCNGQNSPPWFSVVLPTPTLSKSKHCQVIFTIEGNHPCMRMPAKCVNSSWKIRVSGTIPRTGSHRLEVG